MAVQDWSSTASLNTSVGGLTTDGNVQTVNNIDNMFRGMMADIRTGINGGYFDNPAFSSKSGNYTAVAADRGDLLHFTAAATLSLTAAATLTAGWTIMVRARGGDVIVDPDSAELINGNATLKITDGLSAIIICTGTAFMTLGDFQLSPKGHLHGLTLSNNGSDATNDIDIAIGECASDVAPFYRMVLASSITKRLDAAWAVGTNQGGRMSAAAITDTTYHVWLIQRSDTGVVDVGFDVSATSPTMPTNYDRKRRIGSIIRASGAIVRFVQVGNVFNRVTAFIVTNTLTTVADQLIAVGTPTGIISAPILAWQVITAINSAYAGNLGPAGAGLSNMAVAFCGSATNPVNRYQFHPPTTLLTNTNGEIYMERTVLGGTVTASEVRNLGWIDTRGQYE